MTGLLSSLASPVGEALADAYEKSKIYDWMAAAGLYSKALGSLSLDSASRDYLRLSEQLAECFYKAAFQAGNHEELKHIMSQARDAYDHTALAHQKAGDDTTSKRLRARKTFTEYWLTPEIPQKIELLRNCIALSGETVESAEKEQDQENLLSAWKDDLAYIVEPVSPLEQLSLAREYFDRAASESERAVRGFEASEQDEKLLESLHLTIKLLALHGRSVLTFEEFKGLERKTTELGEKIDAVSKKLGTPHAAALRNEALALIAFVTESDPSRALKLTREGLHAAAKTKDSLLLGRFYSMALVSAIWTDLQETEQIRALYNEVIEYGPRAVRNLEVSGQPEWLNIAYGFWANCHNNMARIVETEVVKKRAQLQKAVELSRKGMEYETPDSWDWSSHEFAKSLYLLSTWSQNGSERKQLLTEALAIRERFVQLAEKQHPQSFDQAVGYGTLSMVKAALSTEEQDPAARGRLLKEAISDRERCLEIGTRWQTPERMASLASFQEHYGDLLLQLYRLNRDKNECLKSIRAYREAITYLNRQGLSGPEASIEWKIGNANEAIGDYKKSSEAFKAAADDYEEASKKTPGSASTFSQLASYMRAWTSIQEARSYHAGEEFHASAENYLNAAKTLGLTRQWNHLVGHYEACAFLEKGEAQSREENHEKSIQSFKSAIDSFQGTERELEKKLDQNPVEDKSELKNWLQITRGLEKYAQGRLDLEEAVMLDRNGDEEASARKYRSSSDLFKELAEEATMEQSRRELETLTFMCDAWAKMKEAEVKASPELYSQASRSFNKAQETTDSNRFRVVALANASMCRALEGGTKFRQTRDPQLYSQIKKSLETAADYYSRAGHDNAAEWTRATQRLFDALAYLTAAEAELDSKKKAELYHLSEKHLALAAKLYDKAGYPSKRDEALHHLNRAREEKELLLTPMEALADNPAIAGPTVAPVSLIREQAVGLERFDEAHVVGNIGPSDQECGVGSDLTLELELANVGKTPATLIKLENIAPSGLEINKQGNQNRFEDNYIVFRGKRLDYMKSHEVKVSLIARRKGTFQIRPRILFVDEQGNYKSYEFEPTTVTVKELGISGWLKGPK